MDEVDALWRAVPADHVWTGWAAAGEEPTSVWIFRTQAHWRKFLLIKRGKRYVLLDEQEQVLAVANTLAELLGRVDAIPGIDEAYPD